MINGSTNSKDFRNHVSKNKEDENNPESALTSNRGNSVTDEINIWFSLTSSDVFIAGGVLVLIIIAGILYNLASLL